MISLLFAAALAQEVVHVTPDLPGVNAQLFRQSLDAQGTLWTNDASMRPTKYFMARAAFEYTRDPFLFEWSDGYQQSLLRDAVQVNLAGTIHFWRMRLGVEVPIYLLATSDTTAKGAAGLGPVLVDLKGTILDHDKNERGGVGLALAARTELPTNTTQLSLGKGLGYEVEAIVDGRIGGLILAANIGHRGVPKADLGGSSWDDGLILRGGVGYMFEDKGGLSVDVGSVSVYSGFFQKYTTPVEAMLGGWARLNKNVVLRLGVGTGLTDAIGSPAVRTLASVAWEPTLREETVVEPVVIREPPPPDLPPGPGKLVIRTIDVDGHPVAATAIINWVSVPDQVELPAGPASLDVVDGVGTQTLTPGRVTIIVQGQGFLPVDLEGTIMPDQTTSFTVPMTTKAARRGNDRIDIAEQVFFDLNKDTIRPESFGLLKEIAFLIKQYPQIRMVRIEGHTDSRGSDEYNFALSNDRAESVLEFLVGQGVERDRLNSVGYGERKPLDFRENEEAWALNRRVDFFIEDWDPDFTPVGDGVPTPEAPAP